jgi:2-phosphosulfolactate phosphatase
MLMAAPDLPPPPSFEAARRERPLLLHLHSEHTTADALQGAEVLVIDAIRASVTIAVALKNGARAIVPALSAADAREKASIWARKRPNERVLLGGERGGVRIEGFDLDNSPASYSRERVEGAAIVFTTSNGTAGLLLASKAAKVLVASFVNLSAIVEAVAATKREVHILCCGTRSDISLDDVLVGGALVQRLLARGREATSDDAPMMAQHVFEHAQRNGPAGVHEAMRSSRGGRNLVVLGLASDVELCSTIDAAPCVPVFDVQSGEIRCE